jgi:hypothetical protein
VGSNPTPRAKLLDSSEDFKNEKLNINIVKSLQEQKSEIKSGSQDKEKRLKKKLA